ncbi:hypothetical protein ACFY4C_20405 [Actinomadura viridis]|uniref:hypothetical protein n=1 Tax=Actinomadura viridis TaxID=58110 RepID=UPI0036C94E0C
MDADMKTELEQAAKAFEDAPKNLRAAILKAALDQGEKPATITRTINHVYTADYVARLVREERKRRADTQS